MRVRFTNIDLVAARLNKLVAKEDFVIVTPWYYGISFERYYRGPGDWVTVPPSQNTTRTALTWSKPK